MLAPETHITKVKVPLGVRGGVVAEAGAEELRYALEQDKLLGLHG